MPDEHCADPSLPLHLDQGRGSSKKESFSLRVSPALRRQKDPSHVAPTWPVMAMVRAKRERRYKCTTYDNIPGIIIYMVPVTPIAQRYIVTL